MNEDVIADLKQFVGSLFSQQNQILDERFAKIDERFERIDERFERIDERFERIDERFVTLETKVDDLTGFVTEAIDTSNEITGIQLADHEKRLVRLKQQATA